MTIFEDRTDAGERLADRLPDIPADEAVVVALPRGGLPVAAPIADKLGAPLDILLIRRIGAPHEPELALASVTNGDGMQVTINEDIAAEFGISDEDIHRWAQDELPELERRRALYLGDRPPVPLTGKVAIVVDDGLATGATARAALRLVRQTQPARLILAVPVALRSSLDRLASEVDDVVCLSAPEPLGAVSDHYKRFDQVDDRIVIELLEHANARPKAR